MPEIPININWAAYIPDVMYWLGYGLLIIAVLCGLVFLYLMLGYRYKVTIMQRGGSGKGDDHSIVKIKKERAKEIKEDGVSKWKLLFARKKIQPIEYQYIYPGRNVYLYQSGAEGYHPVEFKCKNPAGEFNPIPYDVGFLTALELQDAARDYAQNGFWDKYGNVAIMMGTVMFCLILVGVTIYYTYQHANGVTQALSGLTEVVKNTNTIPGILR